MQLPDGRTELSKEGGSTSHRYRSAARELICEKGCVWECCTIEERMEELLQPAYSSGLVRGLQFLACDKDSFCHHRPPLSVALVYKEDYCL